MTHGITQTIGLDLGDKQVEYAVLVDGEEDASETGRFPATRRGLERFFERAACSRVILEAGGHSRWMEALIGNLGHEPMVVDPRRLPLISKSLAKTDKRDAELLAWLGRAAPKLLNQIRHRGAEAQADLAVLRTRQNLVQARTSLICAARSQVKLRGGRIPACAAEAFFRRAREHVPEEIERAVLPLLDAIQHLTDQIRAMDDHIDALGRRYDETKHLRQVPGVGPITALGFVLTLEDPSRFQRSRDVGPFLGLVPKRFESGAKSQQLGITKAGDKYMRHMLVQASQYILGHRGPDSDLRRFGERIAARGGKNAKKRAVVAVARKLAVLLHALWTSGATYDPLRTSAKVSTAAA